MDSNQKRQMMAYGQRAGESALVVGVRVASDVLKFLWKIVMDMARSIVGR